VQKTRRGFVMALAAVSSGLALLSGKVWAQEREHIPGMPQPPAPGDPSQQDKNAAPPDPKHEKEFRAGVQKLYQMSADLKEEVEKTMTTDVLSVRMYKKMEDIEKLAKQLKNKVKG
jgi:hypothetical protein